MTTSGESRTSDLVEALDGGAGPALLQSEDRQRAIAPSIVERAMARRARGQGGLQIAAAALLALALASSAWAAVAAYRHADRRAGAVKAARLPVDQRSARPAPPRPMREAPPLQPDPPPVAATPPAPDVPAIGDIAPALRGGATFAHAGAVATGRDLLEQANRLRAARRWRAADRLYSRVAAEHRGSDAAYAALISAATLRLAHTGRPGDALEMYRHALALRPHGSLVEQARYGIAEAHRALVQPRLEAQALRTFLAAHAHSVRASAARARLAELERSSGL